MFERKSKDKTSGRKYLSLARFYCDPIIKKHRVVTVESYGWQNKLQKQYQLLNKYMIGGLSGHKDSGLSDISSLTRNNVQKSGYELEVSTFQ